jgi:hypothetical protein
MDRRANLARMRATLVQAKMGVADLRAALETARARLAREQQELDTMRRRKALAAGIGDAQTVALSEQYERIHSERSAVLLKKIAAQEEELALAERDVAAMNAELKLSAATGGGPGPAPDLGTVDDLTSPGSAELDALSRSHARAEREAEADRKLEELKRRMGK